jgi:hypothetical protein
MLDIHPIDKSFGLKHNIMKTKPQIKLEGFKEYAKLLVKSVAIYPGKALFRMLIPQLSGHYIERGYLYLIIARTIFSISMELKKVKTINIPYIKGYATKIVFEVLN